MTESARIALDKKIAANQIEAEQDTRGREIARNEAVE